MLTRTLSIAFLLFTSVAAVGCAGAPGAAATNDALVVSLGAERQVRLEGTAEVRAMLASTIEDRIDALVPAQASGQVSVALADGEGTMRTWTVDDDTVKRLGTEITQVIDPSSLTEASACVRCDPITCPAGSPTGSSCMSCTTIPCPKPTTTK